MAFPNLLKEMDANGITRATIARRLEVRPNTVSSWFNGQTGMPIHYAFEIRDAYFPGLTVDYLFGASDE